MLGNECQKVKVESLELEVVLDLVSFHIGVDEKSYRYRFDCVKQLLEVGQKQLSNSLVLGVLNQTKDEGLVNARSSRILLKRKLV